MLTVSLTKRKISNNITAISNDIYIFLLIGLSGLMAIEVFQYFKEGEKRKLGDFQLFGLSIFWGLLILLGNIILVGNKPEKIELLTGNPFASGVILPIFGIVGGWLFGNIVNAKSFKKVIILLRFRSK